MFDEIKMEELNEDQINIENHDIQNDPAAQFRLELIPNMNSNGKKTPLEEKLEQVQQDI